SDRSPFRQSTFFFCFPGCAVRTRRSVRSRFCTNGDKEARARVYVTSAPTRLAFFPLSKRGWQEERRAGVRGGGRSVCGSLPRRPNRWSPQLHALAIHRQRVHSAYGKSEMRSPSPC
ncbi:unnamed protein product, partial [Ectocarpus sp. 12 AP-2014]